ncbi:very short patch repair endonuclease [Altererythrobacter rubellus]|uniref:Very short patch repair endonuclease n=1 Tax=Altererythrobacter rubellus TaxID=2173831 RepID=A0A9Y2F256_9SPHN|nr:very short patch repair endonuclease [Altererythrobacter rubellus]WIW95469.1 very short patch repair endonuclease [Altererythrobacter rubellus]
MVDIVDRETRSRMMSGIRGKDTKPEIVVRKLLHSQGFRFRLHRKDLPGRPDIVLPKYRTAVFINGCYWHGHEDCHLFRIPKSRPDFWSEKIETNRSRYTRNQAALAASGWKIVILWECAISKSKRLDPHKLIEEIKNAITSDAPVSEIRTDPA